MEVERLFEFTSEINDFKIRGNSLIFDMLISTREYHGEKIDPLFKQFLNSWKNKEIRWRHSEDIYLLVGEIKSIRSENGLYYAVGEIFGDHENQKQVQEVVRKSISEGKPIGVSTNYVVVTDENETPTALYPREVSITPTPKCEECTVISVLNEEGKMSEEVPKTEESADLWKFIGKETIARMKNEEKELRSKIAEEKVLVSELDTKVKEMAGEMQKLTEKLNEIESEKTQLAEENTQLKSDMTMQTEKMPLINEILSLEKIEEEEKKEAYVNHFKEFTTEQLNFELERVKKLAKQAEREVKKEKIETPGEPIAEGVERVKSEISELTPEQTAVYFAKKHGYSIGGKNSSELEKMVS